MQRIQKFKISKKFFEFLNLIFLGPGPEPRLEPGPTQHDRSRLSIYGDVNKGLTFHGFAKRTNGLSNRSYRTLFRRRPPPALGQTIARNAV